ncbi:mismatch-specific DNA-glycosylase [Corynebacterium sp. 335C]
MEDLSAWYGATIDDINVGGCRLLVVGINPGLWTAKTGAPFAYPGNRFWPALAKAGVTAREIDARDGLSADDLRVLDDAALGFTNVVACATARASELSNDEIRAGGRILEDKVRAERVRRGGPDIVMVAGIGAYRTAFGRRRAKPGLQEERIGADPASGDPGAELWVVPNPSGLNAHETVDSLARAYGEVWRRLGERPGG